MSSSTDLQNLADYLDVMTPTLLIAELLSQDPDSNCRFPDAKAQNAGHAQNRLMLARKFRQVGDFKAARHYADQALRLNKDAPEAHVFFAQLELSASKTFGNRNGVDRAHAHAKRATELDDSDPSAWIVLSKIQQRLGNWPSAKSSIEKALSLGPSNPEGARKQLARAKEMSNASLLKRWLRRL